jgi:NADH-quinone oxidoreductase subunit G
MEEAKELSERLARGGQIPLFTSCCPAWVNYCEKNYPELLPHLSTCRSPMQMLASVIKEQGRIERPHALPKKVVHAAVMPCTAKKFEAIRPEFRTGGVPQVDFVITTQELIQMIRESGIIFEELEPEAVDMPLGIVSGAGGIFGVSGGVAEAVLRRMLPDKSPTALKTIAYEGVRGMEGFKETSIALEGREITIAVVSGLRNACALIERLKAGKSYDFVEVMACPGGCVSGAGQPFASPAERENRGKNLYAADKLCNVKRSEDNPLVKALLEGPLKGRERELLHVDYIQRLNRDHVRD